MELGGASLLLLMLSEGPAFGLELIERALARSKGRLSLNRGGTYLTLRKLERQGSVRSWIRPTGASGRPRRYYELTPKGIADAEGARAVLMELVGSRYMPVAESESRRMAERVKRAARLSDFSVRVRAAARTAGIR
jgi:DNA-binding PadR family transcriptional regulator